MRICSYLPAARVICESDSWRSERDVDAERVRARSWIGHVVETARSDIALAIGVAIRGVDFRIEAFVARQEQEIVAGNVHARRLATHDASGEGEGVANGEILQAFEGAVFNPASRELGRLFDAVAIGQRRGEEITTLRCVTLRLVDQRGVVEGLAAELSAPQPARIEVAPREVVV